MISIIIPAYNSSKYLRRCLDSIVKQGFDDLEIIVINDGSTDDTKEILDDYAQRYPVIKAIHKENEGVSVARNTGLSLANGEHIIFVDSDDYLSDDALKIIDSNLEKDVDLYIYNNLTLEENGICEYLNSEEYPSVNELILEIVEPIKKDRNEWLRAIWAKVYKADILKDMRFPFDVRIGEDACFLVDLLCGVNDIKIKTVSEAWYVYDRTNEGSATNVYKKDLLVQSKTQFDHIYEKVDKLEGTDKYKNTVLAKFCWKLFWILYFQGQLKGKNDDCFKWYEYTKECINKKDLYDIDFENDMMNKSFKYRSLLKNKLVFNGLRRLYLSRNKA